MGGRHLNDITGQRFGLLTAVRPTDRRLHRTVVWECKCDCGNTAYVALGHLKQGFTQSCGCLLRGQAAKRSMEQSQDMIGKRFGRLTAIRPTGEVKNESMIWECKCDCGNTAFVRRAYLQSGRIKSCGCLRRETSHKNRLDMSLAGQRFGQLVALNPTAETWDGSVVWACRCDCGNMTQVPRNKLLNGSVTSCGCQEKETELRSENAIPCGSSVVGSGQRRKEDLIGKRFGMLTVIRPTEERKGSSIVWECICDCGNAAKYSSAQLRTMKNLSCGCEKTQSPAPKGKAIEGKRFGRLTAVRPTEERKNNSVVWECKCDCGNIVLENQVALTRGRVLSCGCMKKEQEQERLETLTKENAGKRFGRLMIKQAVTEDGSKRVRYVCACDCGNEIRVHLPLLERGKVRSCGCLNKDVGKQLIHDLTGQQFGYLTAIRMTDERKSHAVVWECKCVCGKTTYVAANSLKSGNTRSCGCKGKGKTQENG